ncbi:MAG TPA: hypothetical protein VMV68_01040 [Spirochaetia bacterium]|nr:hypothetical protein [Spirochaetia bacterium]
MSKCFKHAVVLSALILGVTLCAAGQSLDSVSTSIPSARTSALGGPHAALADDFTTLFNNPAGFEAAKPSIEISELAVRLRGPIFDIASVAASGAGGNITQLLTSQNVQNLLKSIYASMDLIGPIQFGYVGHGLGFGIFNSSELTLMNTAPFTLGAGLSEQLMLVGGYAFRIPLPSALDSTLDVGVNLKGILQGTSAIEDSLLVLPTLLSSLGASTLTSAPFYFDTAIGVDAGIRYSYRDLLSVGIVGKNIYTPDLQSYYGTMQDFLNGTAAASTTNTVIPFNLSAGVLFTPRISLLDRYITGLKLMLDYNDIVGFLTHAATANNPLLNIGLGTEITLLNILDLRGGFYEGLFSAGLGLDLKYFRIDAAMFGTEMSTQPGLNPVFNILVAISFKA